MDTPAREATTVLTAHQESIKRETARRLRLDMTACEKLLWQHLRGNRLQGLRFYRQQVIDGFIVDFYCDAARLVVEVDGSVYNAQTEYDAERTRLLGERGLLVLRVANTEVLTDTYVVVKVIGAAALARLGISRFPPPRS